MKLAFRIDLRVTSNERNMSSVQEISSGKRNTSAVGHGDAGGTNNDLQLEGYFRSLFGNILCAGNL